MSQIRDTTTTHDSPLKFLKPCTTPEKSGELISFFMKGALSISLLVSIYFVFFSNFSGQSRWLIRYCPSCENFSAVHHRSIDRLEKTNISHILFGIGGSVKTWKDRRHYSELWWKPNTTRGYVWLDEKPNENEPWLVNSPPYRVSEDTSKFKYTNWYGSRSAIRIARIVLESFRLGNDNVRWLVLGDDDTVFFPENLIDVLSRYDHNQMYYIGGNSESVEQDVIHSYGMAFGGGGMALSYPLVVQLVKLLDGCIDRYHYLYGSDERICACVAEIGVSITKELGFHQFDIRDDPYGLLAAHPVAPLVSLHHLDYVKPLFPEKDQLDSLRSLMGVYKMDPVRTLQHSFCYDLKQNWSVSISWGYTVQIYPTLLTAKQLETPLQTFRTWKSWSNGPFTFNTRLPNNEACERPVIFYLDRVDEVGRGKMFTSYKRISSLGGDECGLATHATVLALQTVEVSSSKMIGKDWKRVRRRQCCEIVKHESSALQIMIRRCGSGETVTLP
ncbi:hypothetical protein IFM89_019959 [Coptis chinensis]|uniref:Uncharacterized protein n=1 Tax=Coptis chinensis TaxID=261450 RepID=A0A835HEA9_9MAGN|nr:hypothetical protein IFM89_019959 [Coptis chinensis]